MATEERGTRIRSNFRQNLGIPLIQRRLRHGAQVAPLGIPLETTGYRLTQVRLVAPRRVAWCGWRPSHRMLGYLRRGDSPLINAEKDLLEQTWRSRPLSIVLTPGPP